MTVDTHGEEQQSLAHRFVLQANSGLARYAYEQHRNRGTCCWEKPCQDLSPCMLDKHHSTDVLRILQQDSPCLMVDVIT